MADINGNRSALVDILILYRTVKPSRKDKEEREIKTLFLLAALAIPFFYIPAFFIDSSTNFSTADTWRFWIIHLWVEGFFEVFATRNGSSDVLQAWTGFKAYRNTCHLPGCSAVPGGGYPWNRASLVLEWSNNNFYGHLCIFLGNGSGPFNSSDSSEASDFARLMHTGTDEKGMKREFPHKWTFYFLIAVGVWNFIGAGIFGFLINLPSNT